MFVSISIYVVNSGQKSITHTAMSSSQQHAMGLIQDADKELSLEITQKTPISHRIPDAGQTNQSPSQGSKGTKPAGVLPGKTDHVRSLESSIDSRLVHGL